MCIYMYISIPSSASKVPSSVILLTFIMALQKRLKIYLKWSPFQLLFLIDLQENYKLATCAHYFRFFQRNHTCLLCRYLKIDEKESELKYFSVQFPDSLPAFINIILHKNASIKEQERPSARKRSLSPV